MVTSVLLTEHALTAHDVVRLAHLHDPEPLRVHLLVPGTEGKARDALDASLEALVAEGVQATGDLTPDDPLEAVVALAKQIGADEVLVVTEPHLFEEAVHRDWASRVRAALDRPVLHIVAGTDRVVS